MFRQFCDPAEFQLCSAGANGLLREEVPIGGLPLYQTEVMGLRYHVNDSQRQDGVFSNRM